MWNVVITIAAIVVILLLFELLGLPEWLNKFVDRRSRSSDLAGKMADLESRIAQLEKKSGLG